jgi:hypothetical protein
MAHRLITKFALIQRSLDPAVMILKNIRVAGWKQRANCVF